MKLEADYLYDRTAYFAPIGILLNGNWVSTPRNLNYGESSPYLQKDLYTALTWAHKFDNDWEFKQQFAYYRGDSENTQNNGQQFNISGGPASISNPTIGRQIEPSTGSQATYSSNAYLTGHINTFGLEHTLLLGGDFYKQDIYVLHTSQETFPSLISLLYPIHYGTSFVPGGPVLAQLEDTAPQDTGGLYAQDQIKLPYDVYFMAGARYQYIRQNGGLSASLGSFSAPGATTIGTADTETAVTPRFGLLWRPEQWVSFYANYAEGFSANTGVIYPDTYASADEFDVYGGGRQARVSRREASRHPRLL